MTRAVLGNRHAITSPDHGATFEAVAKGKRATEIVFEPGDSLADQFKIVTDPQGVWVHHAVGPTRAADAKAGVVATDPVHPDVSPAWVASDSPALALLLSEHYGCPVRVLSDPHDPEHQGKQVKLSIGGLGTSLISLMLMIPVLALVVANLLPMLKTNAGNDFQAAQMGGSASATAVAKWVALTANVTAPAAGDTTLTAEIVTGGGGLIRKAGTYAHTTGVNTYTITTVFTANGSDALPVTVGKRGSFDAASAGNMVFESLISPTATFSASGDQMTLTDTVTT